MSIIRFQTASDEVPNNRTVTAATSVEISTEIDIRDFAGGGIVLPSFGSATTLTYYVASKPGGTYQPLYDRDNAAVTQAITSEKSYPLPDEIYGFGALKITADNESLSVVISLKG